MEPPPHGPCVVPRQAGLAAKTINFTNSLILRYIGIESPQIHCCPLTGHYRVVTEAVFPGHKSEDAHENSNAICVSCVPNLCTKPQMAI